MNEKEADNATTLRFKGRKYDSAQRNAVFTNPDLLSKLRPPQKL